MWGLITLMLINFNKTNECMKGYSPVQFLSSESKAKPLSQRQRKLPMVFLHLPLEHRLFIILHSLMSNKTDQNDGDETRGKRWNNSGSLLCLCTDWYLWERVGHWWSPLYERSLGHEGTAGRTLGCPFQDTRHTQGPRLHPLSSSKRPRGACHWWVSHSAHPRGSGSTAQYAGLEDIGHIVC